MNVDQNELHTCSRCHATLTTESFDYNRKGKLFRTCNNCRSTKKEAHKYHCKCGSVIKWCNKNIDKHERTNVHKYWETNKEILEKAREFKANFDIGEWCKNNPL